MQTAVAAMRAIRVVAARQNKSKGTKYCFKASASIRCKQSNRILGTYAGYDKAPDIAKTIERLCQEHLLREDGSMEATPVELVFYGECPTECDGEISVMLFPRE